MSDQLIITLGREFGSGGHAIAVQEARMVFQVLQKKM